ncbi:MAG TPA: pyridoxamine 5'-phosphate oxidase family protein [Acidimicrobiales bacterium]
MATMDDVRRLVTLDHGLASLATSRADGRSHVTVVNAGVIEHPVTGGPVAAFVGRPGTRKLVHLRARSHATLSWRAGWAWCTVEGDAELIGPDDPVQGVTLPPLLRSIYASSGGGEHDDWADYDRVMAAERRLAVLVHPARIYVNP